MKDHTRILFISVVLLLIVSGLAACGDAATAAPTATAEVTRGPRLTPTATEEEPIESASSDTSQDADTAEDTPQDAACINCHTDAETLQALAVDEEPAESLSTGEG